jgi:hypothetical protein
LFTGHTESFVKHTPPFATDDEGKTKASFVGLAQYKLNSKYHPKPPSGYSEDDYVPLTVEQYREHLNGGNGLAVSPLTDAPDKRDVCFFSVIDIDVYDVNFTALVQRLYKYGYKFAAFISKSGGIHLYFFYLKPEEAGKVRHEMDRIIERFGLNKIYQKGGKSRVEVFPMHSARTPGQHDKCIFLPFYNSANQDGGSSQKMLGADGALHSISKAIPIIETMFTSVADVARTTDALPYSDAPFCIQMLILSGSMDANSGRNEFLFTAATYLKTKYGDALTIEHIEEVNAEFPDPLEAKETNSVFNSIKVKDWQTAGRCKKEPVASFCDKQLCRDRKYGVGRQKGNTVSNVEFGKIYRMLAETPYYLWEARLAGTDEYKKLRIDGAENLLNQKTIQKACIDTLGQLSLTVTQPTWEKTVNDCLATLEELEVPKATDTTEMSALRELFLRYLTHRQAQNKQPYTVNVNQVYKNCSAYYFKTDGFVDYLRTMKFVLGRTNLREQLLSYGCEEGELEYTTGAGQKKSIKCWKKPDDDDLRALDTFYDDIMDADAEVLAQNKLNKQDRGSPDADDTRF